MVRDRKEVRQQCVLQTRKGKVLNSLLQELCACARRVVTYPSSWRSWAVFSCEGMWKHKCDLCIAGLDTERTCKVLYPPLKKQIVLPWRRYLVYEQRQTSFHIQWPQSTMSFRPPALSRLRFTILHHPLSLSSAKQPALSVWPGKALNYCKFPHPHASRIST